MAKQRTITKYANRRLYDNRESRYITLKDIRHLVIEKIDFSVIDKTSGEDITRSILLQVINEQEQQSGALMSKDFLAQLIRSHGKVMPDFAAGYLEESMKFFTTQQQNLRQQVEKLADLDPISAVADITQKNIARWRMLQDEMLRRFASLTRGEEKQLDSAS